MCGIFSIISKNKNIKNKLIQGLYQLQNRGYDSAGLCLLNNNYELIKYASTNDIKSINKLKQNLNKINDSNIGISHTRWATHGEKSDVNSHPHISYDGKICIVHNGIIENYKELKNQLIIKGVVFKSNTDTEVICNLIAYNYDKIDNFMFSLKSSLECLQGTWGLVVMNLDTPEKLYCVRHGSPLLIGKSDESIYISSEQSGFCNWVNNYFILDNNDICVIDNNLNINTTNNYELKNINIENIELTPSPYEYWTLKEINEQYDASLRAINFRGRLLEDSVKLGGLECYKEKLKSINNIILLGCGTSLNAGLIGSYYLKELCNFYNVCACDGAEFCANDIPKIGKTALILLSQSGETKDLHRCIQLGKNNKCLLIGVVNVVDSMIARESDCGCYINSGREVGVASTKSFTNQLIILNMIAIYFSKIQNCNHNLVIKYISHLHNLPNDIKKTINICEKNKENFIKILNKKSLFILGKGKYQYISHEGALKIKELSYIHAEGYSASSLKHGPFALLDENLPVILIINNDKYLDKMNNVYEEIKSRKSPIFVITNLKKHNFKNYINIPENKYYQEILSNIPLQFIAYYLSINKNINPDMPKNLAKCVTVE